MRDVVVGHGEDRELRDAARRPSIDAGALEERRQVGVHVPGIAAPAGDLLARGGHLAQRLAVVRDVGHHDQHVQAVLEGEVLGVGQRDARREQPLDRRILASLR